MLISADESNIRLRRLGSLLKKSLAAILPDYIEPGLGLVTVNNVAVSSDKKHANVFISILGNDPDKIFKKIRANIYDIQGELNKTVKMHAAPRINFIEDQGPAYAQEIEEVIKNID